MSTSKDYINYIMPFYSPADFVVKKAKGSYVWDTNNKKYIDLTAGIAVTSLGHSNKELIKVAQSQSKDVWHLSNLYINEPTTRLAKNYVIKLLVTKSFFLTLAVKQ